MQYRLSRDFKPLTETSGIFYAMPGCTVEIAIGDNPEPDKGFTICGGKPVPIQGNPIYARAVGSNAVLNVTPGAVPVDGSGKSGGDITPITDEEIQDVIDGSDTVSGGSAGSTDNNGSISPLTDEEIGSLFNGGA